MNHAQLDAVREMEKELREAKQILAELTNAAGCVLAVWAGEFQAEALANLERAWKKADAFIPFVAARNP